MLCKKICTLTIKENVRLPAEPRRVVFLLQSADARAGKNGAGRIIRSFNQLSGASEQKVKRKRTCANEAARISGELP